MVHVGNPAFRLPVGCMVVGLLLLLPSMVALAVLGSMGALNLHKAYNVYIPALCGFGGLCLIIGCCSCCTLQQRTNANWQECQRQQSAHRVNIGRAGDASSQAQPMISGYDPRFSPVRHNS